MKLSWAAKWALRQSLGRERGQNVIDLIEAINDKDMVLARMALERLGVRL